MEGINYNKIMKEAITLKHISQISGYSISTVSKALNNRSDVSKQAKFKISKIAKSNNYIPNNTALALRSKKTKIIAVKIGRGRVGKECRSRWSPYH